MSAEGGDTGSDVSTEVFDRGPNRGVALLKLVTTVGAPWRVNVGSFSAAFAVGDVCTWAGGGGTCLGTNGTSYIILSSKAGLVAGDTITSETGGNHTCTADDPLVTAEEPTSVKVDIQGSADGATWWNIPYALPATPGTVSVAQITITTAATNLYILQKDSPWRYLRLDYGDNMAVTLASSVNV